MSTLLNALRRAQQPTSSPYIPAMGLAMARDEERPARRWSLLLAPLALVLGGAANYGWHLLHLRPIEETVEVKEVVSSPFMRVEPKVMITRPLPPPLPAPVIQPRIVAQSSGIDSPPQSGLSLADQLLRALNETPLQDSVMPAPPATQAATAQPVALGAAPLAIQQQVPALSYGSHVFSSNASKRAVMLNGREFKEGSEVLPGVRLSTIAQDHIVLQIAGQQVSLRALQDWPG
ncbi:type II secretion system assembly factor GspB [Aeromonas cavernicola]|uniref:General secretion pathway protein GspB n=1 Tax=Aeromonas cavernicola TaxID=1006623 RepID=A0A2H9U219_9GAMM|nr:type II secretion system assembly factor GspB [Aeromonas cavernicola]PJG58073.1 general secretion pathway protein GspB [Aeromonas cavernicola]